MLEEFDLNRIEDIAGAREAIRRLLNLVEELAGENRKLREENQQQRDEINRLKGEQGQPSIKPNKKPAGPDELFVGAGAPQVQGAQESEQSGSDQN